MRIERFNLKFALAILLIYGLSIACNDKSSTNKDTNTSTQDNKEPNKKKEENNKPKSYVKVTSFKGKANQQTEGFQLGEGNVKIVATTGGSTAVGSISYIYLKRDGGDFTERPDGSGLSISTEGTEKGKDETIYRNIIGGTYYISVISSTNWEVIVYQLQ